MPPVREPSVTPPPPAPLRVLLVSPSGLISEVLERYFVVSPNAELAGWTESENHALQLFFALHPDVTILDWRVSLAEPARFVALLKRVAPDARVVCIVPGADSAPARAARILRADAALPVEALPDWLDQRADERRAPA